MRMQFGAALVALLIGSSVAMSAELYIPTKGGSKYGSRPATTVRSVEKSHRPQHGASSCTRTPCLHSRARVADR